MQNAAILRSIHTGDSVDYAFEFLWPKTRNCLILLESLLLTMRRCLPSFKLASGAQLGDELLVLDVENSTGSGIGFLNILQRNRISPIPKALEEKRRLSDCISSSEVKYNGGTESICALEHEINVLGVSECQEPNVVKRKLSDFCEGQAESSQEDYKANQEQSSRTNIFKRRSADLLKGQIYYVRLGCSELDSSASLEHSASINSVMCPGNDALVIKVEYGSLRMLSYLSISSKLVDIKKNIDNKFNLAPGSYKLQFLGCENEWLRLVDEQDWESCITHWRIYKMQVIRLRVNKLNGSMNMKK